MSTVEDILYAPIVVMIEPWRLACRDIVAYLDKQHMVASFDKNRKRPDGYLVLERFVELFHRHRQTEFFVVFADKKTCEDLKFDGRIVFGRYEDGSFPRLAGFHELSIRDMNLYPNTYTHHYVFAYQGQASDYLSAL